MRKRPKGRADDVMNGSEKCDTDGPGQHAHLDRSTQRRLLGYSAGSGVLATAAATVTAFAANGTVRIVLWTAVLGSVSLLAGLAYASGPLQSLRLARQAVQRARVRA